MELEDKQWPLWQDWPTARRKAAAPCGTGQWLISNR